MRLIAALVFLFAITPVIAQNSTKINGYTIHHNAITTDILTPEIAREYGLIRSKNRAMINISVIKDVANSTGQAVTADVHAYTTNLLGQQRHLPLREIRESEAIYYIGDFLVRNRERLNFHIDVKPINETSYSPATFSQEFYTD